jgi:hypothetical protein
LCSWISTVHVLGLENCSGLSQRHAPVRPFNEISRGDGSESGLKNERVLAVVINSSLGKLPSSPCIHTTMIARLTTLIPLARRVLAIGFSLARCILAIGFFIALRTLAIGFYCLRAAKGGVNLACCVLGVVIEFVADANVLLVQVVPEVTIAVFTAVVAFLIIEASRQSALHVFTTQEMAAGPSPKLWNFTLGGASNPRPLPLAPTAPTLGSLSHLGRLSFSDMCFVYYLLFLVMIPTWWPGCLMRAREACFRAREARNLAQRFLFVPAAAEEAPPNSRARERVFSSRESARRSRDSPFRCGEASVRLNFSASPLRSQAPALRLRASPLRFQKSVPYSGEPNPCASEAEATSAAAQSASSPIDTGVAVLVTSQEVYTTVCQTGSLI